MEAYRKPSKNIYGKKKKKKPKKKRIDIHLRITESSSCKPKTSTTGIPTEIFQIPEICIPTEKKH